MPNYILTANSVFQPFTYQELALPIDRQDAYFEKLNEEYDKMSSQADVLEAMGKNDRDKNSKTYAQYKAYSDALRNEADNLYANGLDTESRQRLTDLRRRYNQEIVPIQNAWQKREQEAQMQMKYKIDAASRGVDIRFSRDAANSTLDSYLQNPNQGFQIINGQQITNEVASQFKGLANQIKQDSNGNFWIGKKQLSPIEYSIITQKGMDFNQFQDFINNPDDPKFANIRGIIENTLNAHNIRDFDANTYRDMFSYGAQGVAAGVGARDAQIHTDLYAQDVLNYNQQLDLQNKAHENAVALARAKGEIPNAEGGDNNSIFDVSYYDLPMAGADFSGNQEQQKAMQTLGYSLQDGKLISTGKVNIKYNQDKEHVDAYNKERMAVLNRLENKVKKGTATQEEINQASSMRRMLGRYGNFKSPTNASASMEASIFNDDGSVKTRKEFVAQAGNDKNAQKAFNEYFDKMKEASNIFGFNGQIYNRNELAKKYNELRTKSAAQMAHVLPLNYEAGDWNPTSKGYMVREIKTYRNGKPVYDTRRIGLDALLNKKDEQSNTINVSSYWSDVKDQEGLILATTENGKAHRYFISADDMPEEFVQQARYWFDVANKYGKLGDKSNSSKAREAGMAALHTGLTIHNKPYEQSIVRQPSLKQSGLVGE